VSQSPAIDVVVPAYNEEAALPSVLAAIPRSQVRRIVVADNNSTDDTAVVARQHGAVVIGARRQGYGSACLAALAYLKEHQPPAIVAFLDADFSDHPEELPHVVAPILERRADLSLGSRTRGQRQNGALLPQARLGNALACGMIRLLYGHRYSDLGPFRAIAWESLARLSMSDPDFGWTAEMQVKALRCGLRVVEVPVSYRRRIGSSKISGTLRGSVSAGRKIVWTIVKLRFSRWP
jgi:glycosyltransferase involved in cell wall biosynthesis